MWLKYNEEAEKVGDEVGEVSRGQIILGLRDYGSKIFGFLKCHNFFHTFCFFKNRCPSMQTLAELLHIF